MQDSRYCHKGHWRTVGAGRRPARRETARMRVEAMRRGEEANERTDEGTESATGTVLMKQAYYLFNGVINVDKRVK